MDRNVEDNIDQLKMRRFFNQVEWPKLKEAINLDEIKSSLADFSELNISEGDVKATPPTDEEKGGPKAGEAKSLIA